MEMVKKSKLTAFIFLFSFLCVSSAFALDMGTVDTRILIILHPDMINFDYSIGRFFRNQNPDKNIADVYEMLKKSSEKAKNANAELDKQISDLTKSKFELSRSLYREEQFFAPGDLLKLKKEREDYATILKEYEGKKAASTGEANKIDARKKDLNERIANIDNALKNSSSFEKKEPVIKKLKEQIAGIDEKILLLNDEKRKNDEEALKLVYFTTSETEARINNVKNEIKKIISAAAKEKKMALVLDNSYAAKAQRVIERNTMVPISDGAPDLMSASLFQAFSNYEVDKELEASIPMPPGVSAAEHLLTGRTAGLVNNLRQYLEFKNYLPETASDLNYGSIFLSGGTDLTVFCAEKIFAKYKVPASLKENYINLLREYLSPVEH